MARELIGSKTKDFYLKGTYSVGGNVRDTTNINNFINLPTQLAFNRQEIPGSSYKSIVDQALERAAPGSTAYIQLLKEQSQAISRIKTEAERALEEGRKLRRLEAEAKVAQNPGKTAGDAISIYNFWVDEANKAAAEGDAEYMTIALRNAGNARDTAERKIEAESNKSEAANKKAVNKQTLALYNEWQDEDNLFKKTARELNNKLRNGLITGSQYDIDMAGLAANYSLDLEDRKKFIGELQANDIDKVGGKDTQILLETYDDYLNEGFPELDGIASDGLYNMVQDLSQQIAKGDQIVDVVVPKKANGIPTGETEIMRVDRSVISNTDSNDGVYIRDDFGRYIKLEKTGSGEDVFYRGYGIDPEGNVVVLETQSIDPNEQVGAEGLQIYVNGSEEPVADYSAFVGDQAKDQYNIFGKQDDDAFLQEEFNLAPEDIAAIKQPEQELNTAQKFGNAIFGRKDPIERNAFKVGSDQIDYDAAGIPKVSQEAFNNAIKLPSLPVAKPLAAPVPQVQIPAAQPSRIAATFSPTASVAPPAPQVGTIKPQGINVQPSGKITGGSINLGGLSISGKSLYDQVRSIGNKDIYVDQNEYNQAVAKYGNQSEIDKLFATKQLQKYKW